MCGTAGTSRAAILVSDPTGRLNPGEQYCRSSYPYGEKSTNLILVPGSFQDMLDHTIDLCISPTALFIMKCPVANASHNQTMLDP